MSHNTRRGRRLVGALAILGAGGATAVHAQVIGAYDNFDCFNDTGVTAEGFEIDVEDVAPANLTREFPSNFSSTPWVIRYGLPTVTAYDWTKASPDSAHSYDAGHKGVLIIWAAKLKNGKWIAQYGSQPFANGVAGNGTPYVARPTLTNGDSCWYYGLGQAYPTSGCDHFGISFGPGINPGKITYHWKIPDPTNKVLTNGPLEATIPPSPTLAVAPPVVGAPPVVQAVARAPADANRDPQQRQEQNPQFGDAYWVRITTYYALQDAVLDGLQKANVKKANVPKIVTWKLLQRAPGVGANAGAPEREDAENDAFANNNIAQVTKQYEYFKFSGVYDSETHEALCDTFYSSQAAALNNGTVTQVSCQNAAGDDYPYTKTYWTIDPGPGTALEAVGGNLGAYIGAHINAYNVK